MIIKDIVYGTEEITETVLIDLINSAPLQRLKGVSQFGMPDEYYHKKGYSRFEHSLGVLILLRRLKANIEEQIAGLLHDVSHTAFSHLIDWVHGDRTKEDHQDKTLFEVIEKTEIKDVLTKYGFDYRKIADVKSYSLLEQEAPHLCADRVDYALREIAMAHSKGDAIKILDSIQNKKRRVVFISLKSAELFAEYYAKMNKEHWTGEQFNAEWHILSEVLKKALGEKIISTIDFMKTDEEILQKLKESGNEKIISELNLLKEGFILKRTNDGSGVLLKKKSRYIDPEIFYKDKIISLSEISPTYKKVVDREKQTPLVEMEVKILPLR